MKRVIIIATLLCILLAGCKTSNIESQNEIIKETENLIGVWITFSELGDFAEKDFEKSFDECIQKCVDLGVNNIFVHVRPFCDAVYSSALFPKSRYTEKYGGDALLYIINTAHQNGIKVHAWINPYRVALNNTDVNLLPDKSPAKQWLTDDNAENDKNVCIAGGGIYLNPAENDVKKLILSGVREIIENYSVDGIHLDDYFYPTTDAEFDKISYENYKASVTTPLDLGDWRRQNVNGLIHTLYCAVKAYNKDISFGISPAADIERCYNQLYADIEGWAHGGYTDYIMPQLYFGFEYPKEEFNFDNLLRVWQALLEDTPAKLYVGLANYKIGTTSEPDREEWNNHNDIIARQIELLNQNNVNGFVFFSYSSLFSDNTLNAEQTLKIKEKIAK